MRIFSWLTGNKDHHVVIKRDKRERPKASRFWWFIIRSGDMGITSRVDIANCPPPGFDTFEHAEESARAFLDGIGADYLDLLHKE